jgi:hypothetical protein
MVNMDFKDVLIFILIVAVAAAVACWRVDRLNFERGLYVQAQVDCGCDCRCEKNIKLEADYGSIINPIADPGEVKRIIRDSVKKEGLKDE